MFLKFFLCCLCFLSPVWAGADLEWSVELTSRELNSVNRLIFGQFLEKASFGEPGPESYVDPKTGRLPVEIVKKLQGMKIPLIRFPGGSDIPFTDWKDMIDHAPGREDPQRPAYTQVKKNRKIGNRFGYPEYFWLQRALGCETLLVVNLFDALSKKLALKDAAANAAAQVAYCNAALGADLPKGLEHWPEVRKKNGFAEPHPVKYFQLGNEVWALYKRWAGNQIQSGEMTREEAADWYKTCIIAYVDAMRAVDPNIVIVSERYMGGKLEDIVNSDVEVRQRVDYLTIHRYSPMNMRDVRRIDPSIENDKGEVVDPKSLTAEDWWKAWASSPGDYDPKTGLSIALGARELKGMEGRQISSTEWNWNGWYGNKKLKQARPFDERWVSGIGTAGYLHGMIRNGDQITLANQSMLLGHRWGITSVKADPKGEHPPVYLPQGHVTSFYIHHHGQRRLALEWEALPTYATSYKIGGSVAKPKVALLDAVATRDDKRVYLHVINRSYARDANISLALPQDLKFSGRLIHHLMTGEMHPKGPYEEVGKEQHEAHRFQGQKLMLSSPKRSVSIYELELL